MNGRLCAAIRRIETATPVANRPSAIPVAVRLSLCTIAIATIVQIADPVDDGGDDVGRAEYDDRHPEDGEAVQPVDHATNLWTDPEGSEKSTAFAKGGFSCQIGIMTAPNERRGSNDRRVLDRRVTIRGDRPGAERRTNADRRTGLERRLAILSAEGQIREALRLLTEVIDRGAAPDDEQRSLESALVRLRYALDRLEEEE